MFFPQDVRRLFLDKEFLFSVRNRMHALAGAERDDLVVARQELLPPLMGCESTADFATEKFMDRLYSALESVHNISNRFYKTLRSGSLIISLGLDSRNGSLHRSVISSGTGDSGWLMEAVEAEQRLVGARRTERLRL